MNPWIDVGMWALVIVCLPFLISECIRLGKMYDKWEANHIAEKVRRGDKG